MTVADYAGFAARKKAAKKQGKLRGIGIGCYLEIAGAFPEEAARISFPGGDKVIVSIGSGGSGQGHPTVFPKVTAQRLGIDPALVTLSSGDSDRDVPGFGAVASRSAMYVGGAIAVTADKVIEKGKRVAAMLLQASEDEVDYRDGKFSVKNREVDLVRSRRPRRRTRQAGRHSGKPRHHRQGQSAAVVPERLPRRRGRTRSGTGAIEIVNYVAVGDCGNLLDERIVTGQVQGGVAQGLGQALAENTIYDAGGQLVTGSFMDYAMPHADLIPMMTVEHHAVACRTNPLGTKGTGEAGTTAAPPAVMNAILDCAAARAPGSTCRPRPTGSGGVAGGKLRRASPSPRTKRGEGSEQSLRLATSIFTCVVMVCQCLIWPSSQSSASATDLARRDVHLLLAEFFLHRADGSAFSTIAFSSSSTGFGVAAGANMAVPGEGADIGEAGFLHGRHVRIIRQPRVD